MSAKAKRTRLRPVYITDHERDLIVSALDVVAVSLLPINDVDATKVATKFARAYTRQRILDCIALFREPVTPLEDGGDA